LSSALGRAKTSGCERSVLAQPPGIAARVGPAVSGVGAYFGVGSDPHQGTLAGVRDTSDADAYMTLAVGKG
jgi:hypothetical protein